MDPSNSAPTTAWPRLNETSDSPADLEQPLTAVSLPTRNSIWVDEDVSTAYPQTAHPREDLLASFFPSDSPQVAATQSPVDEGTSELFPEYTEDIRSGKSTHNIVPTINVLPQSPQQTDVTNSHSPKYQPQLLAPPGSSKQKPQRRNTRSSSIISGLDQGIYRPSSKSSQNRDLFYATQKDDSRFSRHHPSSKEYIRRRRASSLDRTSVPTDLAVAKLWDERINAGQQPFTPSDTIPTYQEFRRTTQRVDSPSSDRFPLPASALSQYENIPVHLRPARESDFRFDPKLVQEIYEERWKISEDYEDLQAYFSDPKEGPYKHLSIKEWVELFEYLEERDRKATEREIIFELRAV
ncbi:hypothetical protein EAE96_008816 [Botrytis aclada]|nr:hypothetical protein EAE96_008816 [Botrytis aclada]